MSSSSIQANSSGYFLKEETIVSPFTASTMAPIAYLEPQAVEKIEFADVKTKSVASHVELNPTPKPVADDFMYDFKYNHPLPTTDVLGLDIPIDCDAQKEAEAVMATLSDVMGNGDAQGFADLFLDYGTPRFAGTNSNANH